MIELKDKELESMTLIELIAAILDEKSIDKAFRLGKRIESEIYLARCKTTAETKEILGVSEKTAEKILATIELGKRIVLQERKNKFKIVSSSTAAEFLHPILRNESVETFVTLSVNTKNELINMEMIAKGSLSQAAIHPREVFHQAIVRHAARIMIAHNHPSGNSEPSEADKEVTKEIKKAGEILEIQLIDHIIIGDETYYSFREHGEI